MHKWGDGFLYFEDVGEAAFEIGKFCKRWGRIQVTNTKEKFGTARVYCSFGQCYLHSLIYPGWVRSRFPGWLWKADIYYIGPALSKVFYRTFTAYQKFVYRRAYARAISKYPHIREEILDCADYQEFLIGL